MSQRFQHFLIIITVQCVCVAVGLWVQHQYANSAMRHQAELVAWQELDARAFEVANAVHLACADSDSQIDCAKQHLSGTNGFQRDILLVDGKSRVLFAADSFRAATLDATKAGASSMANGRGSPRHANRGTTSKKHLFRERSSPAADANSTRFADGETLDLESVELRSPIEISGETLLLGPEDDSHLAVAMALSDGSGRILQHRSRTHIRQEAIQLGEPLVIIRVMTLVWTAALFGVAVFILVPRYHELLDRQRAKIESDSLTRIQSLVRTRDAVIFGLAKLADSRDPETGDHLERISLYASMLADALQRHPVYSQLVSPMFVRTIGISSVLHDIGKVGIEDGILRKPGQLTAAERQRMQQHAVIGGECLREIEQRLGSSNFLQMAREIAFAHHEHWDGSGYPFKIKGDAIPLSARIVAVVDVYDALSAKRVYKDAIPHDECCEIIRDGAGTHFDPEIVRIWLDQQSRFREIARRYVHDTAVPVPPVGGVDIVTIPKDADRLSAPAMAVEER